MSYYKDFLNIINNDEKGILKFKDIFDYLADSDIKSWEEYVMRNTSSASEKYILINAFEGEEVDIINPMILINTHNNELEDVLFIETDIFEVKFNTVNYHFSDPDAVPVMDGEAEVLIPKDIYSFKNKDFWNKERVNAFINSFLENLEEECLEGKPDIDDKSRFSEIKEGIVLEHKLSTNNKKKIINKI